MENIKTYFKKDNKIHHFCLIKGETDSINNFLIENLEKEFNVSRKQGNLIIENYESLLVDDARDIKEKTIRKNKENTKTFYLLNLSSLNNNSQNALLKILEEPPVGTYFIITLPNFSAILDTIKSRSVLIDANDLLIQDFTEVIELLKMNYGERISWVKKIIQGIKDEKISKNKVSKIIKQTVLYLNQEKYSKEIIYKIDSLNKNLQNTGVSLKIILEAYILFLPINK